MQRHLLRSHVPILFLLAACGSNELPVGTVPDDAALSPDAESTGSGGDNAASVGGATGVVAGTGGSTTLVAGTGGAPAGTGGIAALSAGTGGNSAPADAAGLSVGGAQSGATGGAAGAQSLDGGGGGGAALACQGSTLKLTDGSNYTFESQLDGAILRVKPNSDLTFDWSGVTQSFTGRPLDANKDLSLITLMQFNLTPEQLLAKLNADTLVSSDLTIKPPLALETNGHQTQTTLLALSLFGVSGVPITRDQILSFFDADLYPPAAHTYALMASGSLMLGQDVRMLQLFQLDQSSSNTTVNLTNGSCSLTYRADLHDLSPLGVPAGKANLTVEWAAVTKTAMGTDFSGTDITRVRVGHLNQGVAELERTFLAIEDMATEIYAADVESGTALDLSTLTTEQGKPFAGIDGSGTWLVALDCGACRNGAPVYLSILKVCD